MIISDEKWIVRLDARVINLRMMINYISGLFYYYYDYYFFLSYYDGQPLYEVLRSEINFYWKQRSRLVHCEI